MRHKLLRLGCTFDHSIFELGPRHATFRISVVRKICIDEVFDNILKCKKYLPWTLT